MERKQKPPRQYKVDQETTLLPFLLASVQDKSRNTVKGLLTRGQVQVNGKTVTRHDHPLTPGQTVTILPETVKKAQLAFPILYEDDKIIVNRARKIQRFLSQPFSVAEQFTGMQGKYVPLADTIRSFKEILEGKHDDLPESAFLFAGTIEDVIERSKKGE